MARTRPTLIFIGLALAGSSFGAIQAAHAESPPASAEKIHVLRYDASGAAEFKADVDRAAQIWDESLPNVQLQPGTPGDIVFTADDGVSSAGVTAVLGHGNVFIGRQEITAGFSPTRVVAHELGHILGLPDRKNRQCADLMAGASAGPQCTNAQPSAAEVAEVEQRFSGADTMPARTFTEAPVGSE